MITIQEAVTQFIEKDEIAHEALQANILNFSAYADKIHKDIENLLIKDVKKGTIVVALARLAKQKKDVPHLKPQIKISNLSVKSSLVSLTYEKTIDIQRKVAVLSPFRISANDLFAITEGVSEITIICTDRSKGFIKEHMELLPKKEVNEVVAVTVQIDEKYLSIPNVLYVLFSALASKRTNLSGVVANYTEISYIVNKNALEETVGILNNLS